MSTAEVIEVSDCRNCRGYGRIPFGSERLRCVSCGGDGRIKTPVVPELDPEPPAMPGRKIIGSCDGCADPIYKEQRLAFVNSHTYHEGCQPGYRGEPDDRQLAEERRR